jgi:hypothetical protein
MLWESPVCEWNSSKRAWEPCDFATFDWERLGLQVAALSLVAGCLWWRLEQRKRRDV